MKKDAISDLVFALVLSFLLLLGAWGIYLYYADRIIEPADLRISLFPMEIEHWVGKDLPFKRYILDDLETDNMILREYSNLKGESVTFYVIYSRDNRHVGHPPELRYLGEGSTITSRAFVYVTERIKATRIVIEQNNTQEMEVFWYKVGRQHTNSYLKQQIKMIADRIRKQPDQGIALIGMRAGIGSSEKATFESIKNFCSDIEKYLYEYIP